MSLRTYTRTYVSLAIAVVATATAAPADAQIIVGRGGGGISINVPGVGGIRLGAPGIYARPYYGTSRRAIVAPYGVAANYGYPYGDGYADSYSGRPFSSSQILPTDGELRAMADSDLLNSVVGLTAQLDADLNRFDTGDTWQRYLRLPEDALPPPSDGRVNLGLSSLAETLKRFERTVAKPEYVQISGLPSFAASHAALAEVLRRFGNQPIVQLEMAQPVERRIPPAIPRPPEPLPGDDLEPRSIEMRNFHAMTRGADPGDVATADAEASVQADQPHSAAEELPSPPPSLTAPQNDDDAERSILAD